MKSHQKNRITFYKSIIVKSFTIIIFVLNMAQESHIYGQGNCCGPGMGDRVKSMTLLYTGENCTASDNNQGTIGGGWNCSGDPLSDPQVYIVVNDKNNADLGGTVYYAGNVNINSPFSAISGNEMKTTIYIHILNQQGGTQVQLLKMTVSCGVPIASGDQFGSIRIVDITFKNNYYCPPVGPCDNFNPEITGNAFVCEDSTEPVTLAVNGAVTYVWSTGETGPSIQVLPLVNTTYSVTVTDGASCSLVLSIPVDVIPCSGRQCFEGNGDINAKVDWQIIGGATPADSKVRIRVTYSRNFVDNTYGINAVNWPGGHTFNNLVGSDKLQLDLYDRTNVLRSSIVVDYISADATAPSGYSCLGVTGGDGDVLLGNLSDVLSATSSLDINLNHLGYVLTVNSPATDASYTPNPMYPDWIFDVWYEVEVRLSVFGQTGYGKINFLNIHASPSKTGNNTEPVTEVNCCSLTAAITGGDPVCQGASSTLQAMYSNTLSSTWTAVSDTYVSQANTGLNYGNCNRLYTGSANANSNRSLVRFNLGDIPANAVIKSAVLTLTKTGGNNNTPTNIGIYRATEDWTEGNGGCSGNNGNASWTNRMTGSPWSQPGGSHDPVPVAVTSVSSNQAYDWNVTPLAQQWISGATSNFGVFIKMVTEGAANEKYFASSENGTASTHPSLYIEYEVPFAPGSIAYNWSNGATTSDITVTPQNSALYSVTITDVNGCKASAQKQVEVYSLPVADAGPDMQICDGEFAFLQASATGGLPPYTYTWASPPSVGQVFSVHPEETTTYYLTVTDSRGCSDTDEVIVVVSDMPLSSAANNGPLTCARQTVTLTAFPASGVNYLWNTGATTRTINVNTAGTYTVTVSGILTGCSSVAQTTVIADLTVPVISLANDGPLSCGKSTITLTASVTGGHPPYTFVWNQGLGSGPSKTITPSVPTTYSVTVYDALGCSDATSVLLTPLRKPVAAATNDGPQTCAKAIVNLYAFPVSGVSYLWSTGAISRTIQVTQTGIYSVTVTDLTSGCTDIATTTVTGSLSAPDVMVQSDGPVSCIKTSAVLTATASGGNPPYTFVWSHGLGTGSVKFVSPSQTTMYSVTVYDVLGCNDISSVQVSVSDKPVAGIVSDGNLSCAKTSAVLTAGPSSGVYYLWNNGSTGRQIVVGNAGTYSVTVTDILTGCQAMATTQVSGDPSAIQVSVTRDNNPTCQNPASVLTASVMGGNPPYQFVWNNNLGVGASKTVLPDQLTTYVVSVTDNLGCMGSAQITLDTLDCNTSCVYIGEWVWYDYNKNDIRDKFENGLNGLTVNVYRRTDNKWIKFTSVITGHKPGTPSEDGFWTCCVPPGQYYFEVDIPPYGLVEVRSNIGTDPFRDSDLTDMHGKATSNTFTVVAGQNKLDLGAGFYPQAIVGNLVWHDENLNGLQDAQEPKISGVHVKAIDAATGVVLREAVSDQEGIYQLGYLEKRNVYFKFELPQDYASFAPTLPRAGNDDLDSDVDGSYGAFTTRSIPLVPGENVASIDLGIAQGVLPLEWLDVTVYRHNQSHILEWETTREIQVSHFEIERRIPGESEFETLPDAIAASTKRNAVSEYQAVDEDIIAEGAYEYRIRQIDFDGKYSYSKVVSIWHNNAIGMEISPNPAMDFVKLKFTAKEEERITVQIFDSKAVLMHTSVYDVIPLSGGYECVLDISGMMPGVYNVQYTNQHDVRCKKLIVVR